MSYLMSYSHRLGIPGIRDDDIWQEEWGDRLEHRGWPWTLGLPTDPKYFPNSGYLINKPKIIPNIFCQRWWYCDEKIKNTIEALEPGRHRFYPYALRTSKKGEVRANLYIIHALEPIEAIDVERSPGVAVSRAGIHTVEWGAGSYKPSKKRENYVVLRPDYPKDRHIWRDANVQTPNGIFISDHLHSIFKQSKNVCVSYMPLWEADKVKW